jgi:hypothetical protein
MTTDEVKSILQNEKPELSESDFEEMESFAETAAKGMLQMIERGGGSMMRFAYINCAALAVLTHHMHCKLEGVNPDVIQELKEFLNDEFNTNKETIH